jgi:hypothetical protein
VKYGNRNVEAATVPSIISATRTPIKAIVLLLTALVLNGCNDEEGLYEKPGEEAPSPSPVTANAPPSLSGNPPQSIAIGEPYEFQPDASDPDDDALTFSIQNNPAWMNFDFAQGTVTGTPTAGDEGTYEDIRITVSDGSATDTLSFSVTVTQLGNGSVTLSWTPPTQNSDGTALTDLAGYRIYYGRQEGYYPNRLVVDNPGLTTYVVENLSANTYYFVATAVNADGIESEFSNVATKAVGAN